MAQWKFSDGSTLRSGGRIEGAGKPAKLLRTRLGNPEDGVHVLPQPSTQEPVDVASDYMLDLLAHEVAQAMGVKVSTAYVQNLDDAPKAIREMVLADREAATRRPYGLIH